MLNTKLCYISQAVAQAPGSGFEKVKPEPWASISRHHGSGSARLSRAGTSLTVNKKGNETLARSVAYLADTSITQSQYADTNINNGWCTHYLQRRRWREIEALQRLPSAQRKARMRARMTCHTRHHQRSQPEEQEEPALVSYNGSGKIGSLTLSS